MITKTIRINDDDVPVLAYQHPSGEIVGAAAVSDDSDMSNHEELVAWRDIADHVDWLERGIEEWRDVALARREVPQSAGEGLRRDRLAERVMMECIKNFIGRHTRTYLPPNEIDSIAVAAYNMADAMIIRRDAPPVGQRG